MTTVSAEEKRSARLGDWMGRQEVSDEVMVLFEQH
jgi:hypothetical protein